MPGGSGDGDDEDPSVEGESRRRNQKDVKNVKEWQESLDPTYRLHPKDELKQRANQNSETLYVHLVAHTHDDVGWLKTTD